MPRTLALALVLLAACSGADRPAVAGAEPVAGPPETPDAPAAPATTASLRVSDGAGGTGPFRIGAVSALTLEAACASAPPGKHVLRLDVVSPSGSVYASVPQEVVVSATGAAAVSSSLPIQGTTIASYLRAGRWQFTLTLDGGTPLASADVDLIE
jgi:hypothetical protein